MVVAKKVALVVFGRTGALLASVLNELDEGTNDFKHGIWIITEGSSQMGRRFDTILVMPVPGGYGFQERQRITDWLKVHVHTAVKPGGELIFLDVEDDVTKSPAELIEAIQDDSTSVVG
jgi:hypothetical protein